MSNKKNVLFGHDLFPSGQDLGASFDTFTTPINVDFLDNAGFLVEWDIGAAPVGELEFWVSNYNKNKVNAIPMTSADFYKLEFATPILISVAETKHVISFNQLPFSWIAVRYARTSGDGTMYIKSTIKEV